MYTIVDDTKEKRRFRTDRGAWIEKLYPGYRVCKYEHPVDAEIAKNFIESKENRQDLKVISIKEIKMKEY
jgi:hypothetical protein|tara:strand:- start:295 stop:504 length:210 start_codon:yes stop_codon:yes gene_type:complete